MITKQDRNAIRKLFKKVRTETDPKVVKIMPDAEDVQHNVKDVVAVQETIRLCLDVILPELENLNIYFCADLAARISGHLVMLLPSEQRAVMIEAIGKSIQPLIEANYLTRATLADLPMPDGVHTDPKKLN